MIFKNGSSVPLNQNQGTVPNVSGAMLNWFQAMVFSTVTKETVNFQVIETKTDITFQGVWQPYTPQDLQILAEGERAWKWFTVHALPNLVLDNDQLITYLGQQYRVMKKGDYVIYGYVKYDLIEDWTGSGPST